MPQRTASRKTCIAACSAGAAAAALAIAACTFGVPAKTAQTAGGTVMLQLTPAGTFKPNDGRELKPGAWRIDAASAQHVIERFKSRGKPPVIDYESEVNPAAEALVATLARRLARGAIVIVDYGFPQGEYYLSRGDGLRLAAVTQPAT